MALLPTSRRHPIRVNGRIPSPPRRCDDLFAILGERLERVLERVGWHRHPVPGNTYVAEFSEQVKMSPGIEICRGRLAVCGRKGHLHRRALGARVSPSRNHRQHHPALAGGHADGASSRVTRARQCGSDGKDGPPGRAGTPEDIAGACSFLCSDDGSYITGQIIGVNGGMYI
jgi:enoyl-ACP reductase-like protein